MAPAIELARYGFPVSKDLAIDFAPEGHRVRYGEIITRKQYVDTLKTIANQGPKAFYTGPIAEATIQALKGRNSSMEMEDLKNYSIGYGQQKGLSNPGFVALNEYTTNIISEKTSDWIRTKISDYQTFNDDYYDVDGTELLKTPGTSHIVTADTSGLSVSMTTTINLYFGSHVMVPETGVIMNNQMNDFDIPSERNRFGLDSNMANLIEGGKRPLSAISPIIAKTSNNELLFLIRCAGGIRITTANIQNAIHLLDGRITVLEALSEPRLHAQLGQARNVTIEGGYDNGVIGFLDSLGHGINRGSAQSSAQGLRRLPDGSFEAAAEPRQCNSGAYVV
ncbi:Glutathione hydrolase proenzyme [Metarhizium brunneum]|uniref:Glutathione hydrolase proenzyme n=1 Tax=Metarhizium brunneum TaxID=500148 RepID=A0A7D5YZY9_9HYPO|nr:Glutathione hydrolase proenzyme [Metarhizium brunneum]